MEFRCICSITNNFSVEMGFDFQRLSDHFPVMAAPPEMHSAPAGQETCGQGSFGKRHMTAGTAGGRILTCPDLGHGAAGWDSVEGIPEVPRNNMAFPANPDALGQGFVLSGRVGSIGISVRPDNNAILDMTNRAGHPFLL